MSWIERLCQTYESCSGSIGDFSEDQPLEPICHVTQKAHITIALNMKGEFVSAQVVSKNQENESITLIPVTEESAGRSGKKPVCHPLCDKLQYVAGDFVTFGGEVTVGYSARPEEPFEDYLAQLSEWCNSKYRHPKVAAILNYVKGKSVMADLIKKGVLHTEKDSNSEDKLMIKWPNKKYIPDIFKHLPGAVDGKGKKTKWQAEAFVRWVVEGEGDSSLPEVWKDRTVWESWINFYRDIKETSSVEMFCYVNGGQKVLAGQHPKKIHNGAVNAKLISSNDTTGYTYLGKFHSADQACGIGFEVTQKAHNALRWLIARQGWQRDEQAIVAWAVSGKKVPNPVLSTNLLFSEAAITPASSVTGDTAQDIGNRLSQMLAGYSRQIGNTARVVVMGVDAASDGCMSVTYYNELTGSDLLARVQDWHLNCSWLQDFGKDNVFVGAPAPYDIAEAAYATGAEGKIKAQLIKSAVKRLLPCIVDGVAFPYDLVVSCVRRASQKRGNRYGNNESKQEYWAWEKKMGIACSLFRYYFKERNYQMALERERRNRDYLYGRLLALAERLEAKALYLSKEKRETNAGKFMQRFADRPYSTWLDIEANKLPPYKVRLKSRRPYFLWALEQEVDSIYNLFDSDEFTSDASLSGEFLLGYHCQRSAAPLTKAKGDQEKIDAEEAIDPIAED